MSKISEIFGTYVFSDSVMRERLPKETYKALKQTISEGSNLDSALAGVIANAMKDWAIEKGATHYTHWFQPMTGITAEKHDSFLSRTKEGHIIMEFSGKELVKGEADASSFPSGGLRATFEARGYTAWDPTSYAFIKENTLCIPTVFCSFGGEALDKKTPLLKSLEALSEQTVRILRLFGHDDVKHVTATMGAEQEYFLIDKSVYDKRKDLVYTGRTLFGTVPPKGQELDVHYFGSIKPRVKAYMSEVNEELWKLGILAKTEHNEAAPAQHELAPVYTATNIATDHNQIIMDVMKKVAARHNMVCLLHEKPFAGVNGSGKHNNWGFETDTGINLLKPGASPYENAQFLLFLCAVLKAVDEHQDLLRISVATAGNDHRLGAHEAPPAVISIFLGDELTEVLNAVEKGSHYVSKKKVNLEVGVHTLPTFPKDNTDRNRTSPFAFTGNKFEFRMPGSSLSIAGPNIVLNTIVADVLMEFADKLERAKDFKAALNRLIKKTIREHKRIIFNGNGYTEDWLEEAKRRGLLNLPTSADALPYYTSRKNVDLFARHKVFTEAEIRSRCDIMLENYSKTINVEALTMVDMATHDLVPAVFANIQALGESVVAAKGAVACADTGVQEKLISELSARAREMYEASEALNAVIEESHGITDAQAAATFYKEKALPLMTALREAADGAEKMMGSKYYPYPTYGDILFSVQ